MKGGIVFVFILITLTSICDTISQLFLKSVINSLDFHINSVKKAFQFVLMIMKVYRVWIGFLFSTLSLCIWLLVLSKAELNFAFSVDSMHYIFIAFASALILKEKFGTTRWLGTLAIVAGIALVTVS
ncbi:MAG: hypothetical protein NT060_01255 [Candidatus Omnitrophica bacterium]|nr:hypothetical protein [Candidatus Omnitrophota bacterium]